MLNRLKAIYQVMRDVRRPRSEMDQLVYERMRDVLVSAYQNVPYYRKAMQQAKYNPSHDYSGPTDISVLPVTTKEDIKKQGIKAFVREGSDLSQCFSESTSGSTGIPLRIYRTSFERAIHVAKWLRVLFVNGYALHHKVMAPVSPERAKMGRSVIQKLGFLRRNAVDYVNLSAREMVDILLAYQPDILYGNRSHLDLIALELKRRRIRPETLHLKLVVGAAEIIHESNRRLYRKYFGLELIENYGSVEMGTMAYETPAHDGLHLCEDLVYFEILNKNGKPVFAGEPGRVVVTDLTGKLMPLIRYDQGDWAIFAYQNDSDGRPVRRLTKIIGRDNDYAILPDGKRIPAHDFNKVIGKYDKIMQFRTVQRTKRRFEILIVADSAYFSRIRDDLAQELRKNLPQPAEFEIILVKQIDPDPTGKIRTLVSDVRS